MGKIRAMPKVERKIRLVTYGTIIFASIERELQRLLLEHQKRQKVKVILKLNINASMFHPGSLLHNVHFKWNVEAKPFYPSGLYSLVLNCQGDVWGMERSI